MKHDILIPILLIAVLIPFLSVASRRLRVPSSIFAFFFGVAIAYLPGLPFVAPDPQIVLLLLLPPLLYASGVGMSWRGFRSNLRPILLLAVGCVLFTAATVALVSHYVLGLPWAIGFLIGSIVSPPDAVAPMSIARRLGLPRRVLTILEGESLVNDATALVAYGFALTAVITGEFSLLAATLQFAAIVAGEIIYGVLVASIMLRLRHVANDPRAEVLLALTTPFVAFWPPHWSGGSGVIACVAAGLWVSWNGRTLIRSATRLQGYFIWDLVTWVVEALTFLLSGLETPTVLTGLSHAGWERLLVAGGCISLTVVVVRFIWVYPATYLPRWLSRALAQRDPAPNWRVPTLIGYTGLRGAVSLVAALSIPFTVDSQPFPERDFILFVTFCVIVVTLTGQGITLPWVIRKLGLAETGREEAVVNGRAERSVRIEGVDAVLRVLDSMEGKGVTTLTFTALRRRQADRRAHFAAYSGAEDSVSDPLVHAAELQLTLLDTERAVIQTAYAENRITDEARRRIEREIDLEEARLRHVLGGTASVL